MFSVMTIIYFATVMAHISIYGG